MFCPSTWEFKGEEKIAKMTIFWGEIKSKTKTINYILIEEKFPQRKSHHLFFCITETL